MVNVERGQLWWVDVGIPRGSSAGYRRPALVVQADAFDASRISTVLVVPPTSSLRFADAPGNVLLTKRRSGLPRDSVVNVTLTSAIDRADLVELHGRLDDEVKTRVDVGLLRVLALS